MKIREKMKTKDTLSSTNQLIRFIRGDLQYEEFYDLPSKNKENRQPHLLICAGFLLIAIFFTAGLYLFLSNQLKVYKSQLAGAAKSLEKMRGSIPFVDELEARESFCKLQEGLYEDLLSEKLSMACIIKELTHLIPPSIYLKRIFWKNIFSQEAQRVPGKRLILEGSIINRNSYADNNFSSFLTRLHQSCFWQNVQVTYQNESITDMNHGMDFILTCDLK